MPDSKFQTSILLVAGLLQLSGFVALALLLPDIRQHMPEAILLLLVTSVFYLISCYLARGKSLLLIGGFALAFRFAALWIPCELTDDLFRYRWEGKLQAAGGNPYQSFPNDPKLSYLKDETFPRVAGRDFKAGYGPLWEKVELWLYRAVPDRPLWFRLPAILGDLGILLLLWWRIPERSIVYAWCPLPVLELWTGGHHDGLVVALVVAAMVTSGRLRGALSFGLLTLAGLIKWWPFLLFPIFMNADGRKIRWWQPLVAVPLAVPFVAAYWGGPVQDNVRFMAGFLGGWRNNDSLFGVIHALTSSPEQARTVSAALIAVAAVGIALLRKPLIPSVLGFVVTMLALSANVHPWYLTWMVPLLAFYPLSPLLLWVCLAPLSYVVLIDYYALGVWQGSTAWRWWIYVPVLMMMLVMLFSRHHEHRA